MGRRRKAKAGELIAYYGSLDGDSPDLCFSWGGAGAYKGDGGLLCMMFTAKSPYEGRTFIEELASRGYDLSTMHFTIQRREK